MDSRRFEQVSASMDHLTRVFVQRSDIFQRTNSNRILPSGFEGITLIDVLKWLFQESGRSQYNYRHKCMTMFTQILPEGASKEDFHAQNLGLDRILAIGEAEGIGKRPDLLHLTECQEPIFLEIYKWMEMFLTSLDFYIWIFESELLPKDDIGEFLRRSVVVTSITFFLKSIANKDMVDLVRVIDEALLTRSQISLETKMSNRNLENIDTIRCVILVRIVDFLTILIKEQTIHQFLSQNETEVLKVVKLLIFKPQRLNFDHKTQNPLLQLKKRLVKFIETTCDSATPQFKKALQNILQKKMMKHFNKICHNFETFLGQKSVNALEMNLLNGLELVIADVKQHLDLDALGDELLFKTAQVLVNHLFAAVVEVRADIPRPRHLTPSIKAFATSVMRLCFKIDAFLPKIILFSFNSVCLKISDSCIVLHGEHFLQTFKNPIFEMFTSMLTLTVETLVAEMKDTLDTNRLRLLAILADMNEFIFKSHQDNLELLQENVAVAVAQWPSIMSVAMKMENKQNCVDLALINFVTHMAMTSPIELCELGKKLENLQSWLFTLFENKENSLELKSKAVLLLPCITSSEDKVNEKLMKALNSIQQKHLPLRSKEFLEGSLEKSSLVAITNSIFKSLLRSKSPVIYRFIINVTVADDDYILESKLQQTQVVLMESSTAQEQETFITQTFDAFLNGGFEPEIRLSLISRFLLNLMKNAHVDVMLTFFQHKLSVIWGLMDSPLNADSENALVNRCGAYMIVEAFFASVPCEKVERESFSYAGKINNGTGLIKDVIKKTRDERRDVVFIVDDPVKQELFRKYQCYCYRALAATVSNTKDNPELYNITLFKENPQGNSFIWSKLIDTRNDDLYQIATQEFEELPRIKEYIISVKDLKSSKEASKKYIESISIFDRSLSQSLTKNDLTYSVVYSNKEALVKEQERRELEHQQTMKVLLEATPVNDHEVMSVLVGVINHISNSKISPCMNLEKYELKKYEWVVSLAASMRSQSNHKNVRIFIAKLVDNCRSVFVNYAKLLLGSVLSVITDGCLGSGMSYFVTDLVTMMLSWSHVYKPSELSEKQDACALLKFLMENAFNERDEIFKLNLELIKRLVETWSDVLAEKIPTQTLLDLLQSPIESNQRIKCGIQLNAVILANDLVPWTDDQRNTFITAVVGCFSNSSASVYQAAAQLLGMFLNKIVGDQELVEGDEKHHLVNEIVTKLDKIRKKAGNDANVFLQILYGIQKGFPRILDNFMTLIKFNIPRALRKIKCIYLEMFLARLEIDAENVYREIIAIGTRDLLKQSEYQLLALHIVNKALEYLNKEEIADILDDIVALMRSPNDEVRKVLYEIMIFVVEKYKQDANFDLTLPMRVLLKGFTDSDVQIYNRVTNFFSIEGQIPKKFALRFQDLLENYYDPSLEREFLHYSTQLLLDISIRHPRSKKPLLDYDHTKDRDFFEYPISTKSSSQRSLPPLFIQSQQTQLLAGEGSVYDQMIRATQLNSQNQMFSPTQDPIKMSQVPQTFSFKQTQDSLFVGLRPQFLDRRSKSCSQIAQTTDDVDLDDLIMQNKERAKPDAFDYLRMRVTRKDDQVKSKEFALKAIDRRNYQSFKDEERVRKSRDGREVVLYRRYRLGDFPDFFFNGLAILMPLQALAKKDDSISRDLFIAIFESIREILSESGGDEELFRSINKSITSILQRTKNSDSFLLGTLFEMAMKSEKYMEIAPSILANVSASSNTVITGVLLLESQLVHLLSDTEAEEEPSAKRRRLAEDQTILNHWLKLIELYYKVNEYEVILGVFTEKLDLVPAVRSRVLSAIDSESSGLYGDASKIYQELIRESAPRNRNEKEFYYQSYFSCLANLSDWREIAKEIRGQFDSYREVWDEAVPFHKDTLLPHLLKSELRMILNDDADEEFIRILEDWINDEKKSGYLRQNFPEEVTMLHVIDGKFAEGCVEAGSALRDLCDGWSCLEMLDEKLKCLKNARTVAEINNFIGVVTATKSIDKKLDKLYQNWKLSDPKPSDSLIQWGDLISYRRNFHKLIDEDKQRDITCILDMQRNLINVAFAQNNCDAAKFLINGLKDEIRQDRSEEKIIKCNLAIGKYNLIVTEQKLTNPDEQMIKLSSGLKKLTEGVFKREDSKKFPKILIETYCCASDIASKLWNVYESCRGAGIEVPPEYEARILELINAMDDDCAVSDHLLRFSENSLKEARKLAQKYLDENYSSDKELMLGDTYLRLGKFYQQVYSSGTITVRLDLIFLNFF